MFYSLSVHYDGMSDRIVVNTDAPSWVTSPLLSAYTGQIAGKNRNLNLGVSGSSAAPRGGTVQLAPDSAIKRAVEAGGR